jgi:DNA-binding PucR family transcriptional regulator
VGEEELYSVLDYILNRASEKELEAVTAALKKRLEHVHGAMGLDPSKMAKAVSDNINEQVQSSIEQVHKNVQGFIARLIKQEVPDIPDEHLQVLLDTWAPEPGKKPVRERVSNLPPDVLLTMIRQFLSYSLGMMGITEQEKLRDEIPDWQEEYWRSFPPEVQRLISMVLKGNLDEEMFWHAVEEELGLNQ